MGWDSSLSAFIGACGGLAYVLVGLLALASRGAPRPRLLFGSLLVFHGVMYALLSLTTPEAPTASASGNAPALAMAGASALGAIALISAVLAGGLAIVVAEAASRRTAWSIAAWLGILLVMAMAFAANGGIAPHKGDASLTPKSTHYIFLFVLTAYGAAMALVTAFALRWKMAPASSAGLPLVAACVAVVPLATLASVATSSTPEGLLAAFAVASVLPWLRLRSRGGSWTGVKVALGLLSWAAFWEIVFPRLLRSAANFQGTMGVVEVGAAFGLALAVLRHHAFGIDPPNMANARGAATAAALAALFVVAQIAQNFLSAEFGLLLGGAVAGAFLFAASPIQRALEGRVGRISPAGDTRRAARSDGEEAYRKALRIALRDRNLTRDEETHLYELADQLGIGAGRARALMVEIEREVAPSMLRG